MVMAFFLWWYGEGWQRQLQAVVTRMTSLADFFSLELIVQTLFAPFRQISAGRVDGPIGMQLQAFIDRTVSRFIGALVRLAVLMTGLIAILSSALIGIIYVLIWPLVPFLPLIGFVFMVSGWTPQLW